MTLWGALVTLRLEGRAQAVWISPMQLAWVGCEQFFGIHWHHAVVGGNTR